MASLCKTRPLSQGAHSLLELSHADQLCCWRCVTHVTHATHATTSTAQACLPVIHHPLTGCKGVLSFPVHQGKCGVLQAGSVFRDRYSLTGWRWRSPNAIWCGADQVDEPWGPVALKMYALTSDFIREKELLDMPYSSEHWPSRHQTPSLHHCPASWLHVQSALTQSVLRQLGPLRGGSRCRCIV